MMIHKGREGVDGEGVDGDGVDGDGVDGDGVDGDGVDGDGVDGLEYKKKGITNVGYYAPLTHPIALY